MVSIRQWSMFIVFLALCMSLGSFCRADDRAKDRATLRGIEAIVVDVRTFENGWRQGLSQVGLSESFIQAAIEGQLEKAGIKVVPQEASGKSEAQAFLIARLTFKDPEPGQKKTRTLDEEQIGRIDLKKKYAYAIRLNLRQPVVLQRDAEIKGSAITWQTEALSLNRITGLQDDIRRLVEVFLEAYFSENDLKNNKE